LKKNIELDPKDNSRLLTLRGDCDKNIAYLENYFKIKIINRGFLFEINDESSSKILSIIKKLYKMTANKNYLSIQDIQLVLQGNNAEKPDILTKIKIKPKTTNQEIYLKTVINSSITFAIGPAGTGKTYLAVLSAVEALKNHAVKRIIISRPAIEAGEKLGFLPGDLKEKIDPYLQPLYDSLYSILSKPEVDKMIDNNIIEIIPLAYMRGRTLNNAFIILDESQNTTSIQMKMFLTRIGFNSKMIINGDITQTDLPKAIKSGLKHAEEVLKNIKDISFIYLDNTDVVRHPVVSKIIQAYENSKD
jgi:phosphate starvation-inducible PhoH-like protein